MPPPSTFRAFPLALALTLAAVSAAHATPAPVTLPGAVSYEYFGLNFADNIQTSNTVGTLNYGGGPGCGGVCSATTALGFSPSVSATVNEVEFEHTSGGVVQASLGYYMEYVNAPGDYAVNVFALDQLSAPDGSAVSAHLKIGQAGTSFGAFNNFASVTMEEADCLNRCPAPGFVVTPGPFTPNHLLNITANTLYFVQMDVLLNPGPSNVEISGKVDPMFTTDILGGEFLFSPGVLAGPPSGGIPEPSAWALMILGFGATGAALRRRALIA